MKDKTTRLIALLLLIAVVLMCGACKPKATATASPTPAPERPEVTPAPDKVAPPAVERFAGYTLSLKPTRGPAVILQEPVGAQLIMDAFSTERLVVADAVGKFGNKLEVLDETGKARYRFTIASDGQLLMKAEDGRVIRMPEYIYYLMEEQLWVLGGSLMETDLKWEPDKGTAQMELDLNRLLKTAMLPAFGYASAYFTTYTIYGMNTETKDVAKVYLLLTYAGYDIDGTSFAPSFLYTTPATAILKKKAGVWRMTALKQPPVSKEAKDRYNNVRMIFPYEHMEAVLEDLNKVLKEKDESLPVKDIVRQAAEYLNDVGISGLTVES